MSGWPLVYAPRLIVSSIDTPFELVKKDINDTFAGLSFDASVLPVPEQNTVSFCGDMDTSVVDDLSHDLVKIAQIGVIILIVVAILLVGANCALEWYKWRCLKNHLQYTREAWTSDPSIVYSGPKSAPTVHLSDHNLMMLSGNMQHPLLTKIANRIARLLRFSPSQYVHLTWFFHYVFHPPALACFLIGFFGLLSVQIQLIAIGPLEHKYSQQAAASVNDFSNTIATSINASMYNQSAAYASDINGRVDHIQSTVNDGLFGWVNGTTTTLNDTINTCYTDIQDAVNTVFNGTILEEPIQEFIRCFIGSKVDAIESALTFLHDNLVIDIPRVNDTVLVLSPDDVNEAVKPIATAAIGGGDGNDQGVVGKLVNAYVASLYKERIMFAIFMGLWGLVVLMALAVIFWHSYARDWYHAHKKRRFERRQRAGIQDVIVPFRIGGFGTTSGDTVVGNADEEKAGHVVVEPVSRGATLHPYPRGRNAAFEKSWESILDEADSQPDHDADRPTRRLTFGGPRKLQPRFYSAKDNDTQPADAENTPWYTRFTASLWKRKAAAPTAEQDMGEKSPPASSSKPERTKPKPKLTITTSDGSVRSLEHSENGDVMPSSAWSVSPRKPTWIQTLAPPKLPVLRAKPRHRASVPVDVSTTEPSPADAQPAPAPDRAVQFSIPLHHGFPSPPPHALSPPFYANRHPSSPPASVPLSPPVRSANAHPASAAVDPFATPFDDVPYESPSFDRKHPFVAVAI